MLKTILTAITAAFLFMPATAQAQNYGQTLEQVQELNIGNPVNGGRFDRSNRVFKRKVQDRKNKVVGTLQDIIVSSRGYVETLEIKFDRLNKPQPVYVDVSDAAIRSTSGGYRMSIYSSKEIEEFYPTLLANIQTAAGSEDIYSVKNIIGATLRTDRGQTLGKVEDVLFNNEGDFVHAFYVKLGQRTRTGLGVAVPFSIAQFDFSGRHRNIIITEQQAKAITDFSERQ